MPLPRRPHPIEAVAAACVAVAAVIAFTVLGYHWMSVTLKAPPPVIHVRSDTVVIRQYDTVTVIARAKDTVRVVEQHVGPLTEQRVAQLICGKTQTYGDERDRFGFNALGMVFCPKDFDGKERK